MRENTESAKIKLSEHDLDGINKILSTFELKGGRYMDAMSGMQVSYAVTSAGAS